ncbi:binding partner of ACD11 1-like isoform X1 [Andrographis paniculata]|uniref:binding partner of ACD11 1-like isoform X1 n=1 Tax=Andrographis paniculata TaxID=175694 RepID=UPI0021E79635|nr:binding partner of ACD11 1-like isoform X1 [Andrographis paniculata]XP_051148580.1 binding partner of ACD11 1-like isoform X1 [Andrographis paniculata]
MDNNNESGKGEISQPTSSSNWTIDVSEIRTVKVTNVAEGVSERDINKFFSFSGQIEYIEMQRDTETTKVAYVMFRDSQGADTAALLTGATIAGVSVSVALCKNYQPPPDAVLYTSKAASSTGSAMSKAEEVVTAMLAKGFVLGKDAINKAKAFDEKHQLTSNASAKVASLDRKMGLSRKLSMGTAVMNEKVKEMDEKFQVSEKTRTAFAAAGQTASSTGSAIMNNWYVSTSALWFTNALTKMSKKAEGVSARTKEKVEAEAEAEAEEGKESCDKEEAEAKKAEGNESPTIPVISADETNK